MIIDLADCDPQIADNGNLHFALPGGIGSACEIGPWSSGCEARTVRGRRRAPGYFWTLRLIPRDRVSRYAPKIAAFIEQIPSEIRDGLAAFEFGQGFMLPYLARHSDARDLFRGNPNLFWLIAAGAHEGSVRPDDVLKLCRAKQVDALGRLLWPVSKATLRLLRKTRVQDGSLGEAKTLRDALMTLSIVEATAHESEVPLCLLTILTRYPSLVQRHLVRLLSQRVGPACANPHLIARHLSETLTDISRMAVQLRIRRPERALRQCRTIEEIYALHERWVRRMNHILYERYGNPLHAIHPRPAPEPAMAEPVDEESELPENHVFPEPPFPDSKHVQAIRTAEDLREEGRTQRHCAAAYVPYVAAGELFVYRVLYPQRATLELLKTPVGWSIGQLKLRGNADVCQATRDVVTSWLGACVGNDVA